MAPSFEASLFAPIPQTVVNQKPSFIVKASKLDYEPGRSAVENHDNYEHEDLRPQFPDVRWPTLTEIPYHDKGLKGDPKFRNLLVDATNAFDYTPKVGTEIRGVNLARLTDAQKNDLARLIATRGVVFFRGQEDFDIDAQRELGKYFGTLHKVRHTPLLHVLPLSILARYSMLRHQSLVGRGWKTSTSSLPATTPKTNEHSLPLLSCGTLT